MEKTGELELNNKTEEEDELIRIQKQRMFEHIKVGLNDNKRGLHREGKRKHQLPPSHDYLKLSLQSPGKMSRSLLIDVLRNGRMKTVISATFKKGVFANTEVPKVNLWYTKSI